MHAKLVWALYEAGSSGLRVLTGLEGLPGGSWVAMSRAYKVPLRDL